MMRNYIHLAVLALAAAFAQGAELSADFSVETGAVRRALHSSGSAHFLVKFDL